MKLKIELLSDLCTYSGETYNSMVDTDVVYDDYGFPYIPAKRLKGCIRESYLELAELGVFPSESLMKIFGKEGNQVSAFSLSNAYLEDYEKLLQDLKLEEDKVVTHPQNVLRLYTYTRTQTSLDLKSGTAMKNTLRTMRVVKKGLVFEADIHFSEKMSKTEKEQLIQAIEMVCHIGYQRSRGLGNVRIEVIEADHTVHSTVHANAIGDKNKIFYSVKLHSPMLCKSAEGNQAKTLKYLEGSKVLGMLAGAMGQDAFRKMMADQSYEKENELIVSNAYIESCGKRCTPLRASLQKKKDQKFKEDGTMEVSDMLFVDKTTEQMTSAGYLFADSEGYIQDVETEINYHHKRPSDKSIGRATGKDDSAFYQLESIRKGQIFRGYILANKEQTGTICDAVRKMKNVRMGYGRSSQYGAVEFQIDGTEQITGENTQTKIHDFQVKLNSAVIMFNKNGMYSADIETLESYLCKALGTDDLEVVKSFLKYETIGGFNVTWNRRKPVFTALGMGTVCELHSEKGIDEWKTKNLFIGERVSEGFGEIEVTWDRQETHILRKQSEHPEIKDKALLESQTEILQMLYVAAYKKNIAETAREDAEKLVESERFGKEADAVISRMTMICKEQDTYEKMHEQVTGIESESKLEIANKMDKNIGQALQKEYAYHKKIEEKYQVTVQEIYRIYSNAYLKQMKYLLRPTKAERRADHEQ